MVALGVVALVLGAGEIALGGGAASVLGSFLVLRRSGVRIGVVLLGFGSASVLSDWSSAYLATASSDAALLRPVAIVAMSVFVLVGTFANTLLFVFPTGSPRPRWRWPLRALLTIGAVGTVTGAIWALTRPTRDLVKAGMGGGIFNPAEAFAGLVFLAFFPLALTSLFFRYRSGGTVERHQIRWLLAAATAVFLITFTQNVIGAYDSPLGVLGVAVGFLLFPVGIGIAVLRYRLFDIDRIISRTVSYVLVIGLLVAVYASIALGPTLVMGSADTPPWLVAGATLTAAALFNPARTRMQALIDRHFNRARYDAEREIEGFADRVGQETDGGEIAAAWAAQVGRVLQPSHVGAWIRDGRP